MSNQQIEQLWADTTVIEGPQSIMISMHSLDDQSTCKIKTMTHKKISTPFQDKTNKEMKKFQARD